MSTEERALFEGTADTETPKRDPWGWRKATLIGVGLVTLGALIAGVLVLVKGDTDTPQREGLNLEWVQDAYDADTPNPNHVSERGLDPHRIVETREALGLPRACDPNTSRLIRDIGFVPCQDNTKEK